VSSHAFVLVGLAVIVWSAAEVVAWTAWFVHLHTIAVFALLDTPVAITTACVSWSTADSVVATSW